MSEHPKTPAPPKTSSGEMPSVKAFREAITAFDDDTVPKLDNAVGRMGELLRQVSSSPASKSAQKDTPIPGPPRSPSFVDEEEKEEEERAAAEDKESDK